MAKQSFWASLAKALGMGKGGPNKREAIIAKHITDLKDPDPYRRRSAAWSLGKMEPAPREAIPILEEVAAKDPDQFVRRSANWALKRIR